MNAEKFAEIMNAEIARERPAPDAYWEDTTDPKHPEFPSAVMRLPNGKKIERFTVSLLGEVTVYPNFFAFSSHGHFSERTFYIRDLGWVVISNPINPGLGVEGARGLLDMAAYACKRDEGGR